MARPVRRSARTRLRAGADGRKGCAASRSRRAASLQMRESEPQSTQRDAVLRRGSPLSQEAEGPVPLMRRRHVHRASAGVQHRSHQVIRLSALGRGCWRCGRSARSAMADGGTRRRIIAGRMMLTARPLRHVGCLTAVGHFSATAATMPATMGRTAAATSPLGRLPGGIRTGRAATARESRSWLGSKRCRQHPRGHFLEAR